MRSPVTGMFLVDGEPVHDPPVKQDFNANDRRNYQHLLPVKELPVRQFPVERKHRDNETIRKDAHDGEDCRTAHDGRPRIPHPEDEQETRKQHEAEHLIKNQAP